jgi:FkbM family methyltransferase
MIELAKNPHLGTYAGFPNDYLFGLIKDGSPFIDDYVQREIDRYVTKDSLCADVGANLGYISVYLSRRARWVYSVEPQPVVYLQLCCNLFLNECYNVTPINMAATSRSTWVDFAEYQSGWVGTNKISNYDAIRSIGSISLKESPSGKMRGERLDVMINERVDFIKIDAQGADIDVILGAEDLIKKWRPVIVFEYEEELSRINYGRALADLDEFQAKHRYGKKTIHEHNYLLVPEG